MKTSVIEVRDMLSVLSVLGVEQRIGEVPGVESVTVNFSAASATVRYDETRLDIADIKSAVRQRAYEADTAPAASPHHGGEHHAAPGAAGAPAATPDPAAPKAPPVAAAAAKAASAGTAPQDNAAPSTLPKPATDAAATAPAAAAGAEQTAQAKPGKS